MTRLVRGRVAAIAIACAAYGYPDAPIPARRGHRLD